MFGLGMQELMIIGVIAVLLFGRKLPEVARSMGTSYREFRKGLTEFQSHVDIRNTNYTSSNYSPKPAKRHEEYDDYEEATAPKFEPPPAEPEEV